jgi:predicted SAM-dependent methyltransferase
VPKGLFSFLSGRSAADAAHVGGATTAACESPAYPTKALGKFLKVLQARDNPALIDLGPVVGSNVTFFGEQLGCRIRVEDIAADIERHVREERLDQLPAFFASRFKQDAESVDGILCWDIFDFLDRASATALAQALTRLLRPEGALLAFFSAPDGRAQVYTKFLIVNDHELRHRAYPSSRARQKTLQNRDIIRMFDGLRVAESFLLKNNVREILLRKPAYPTGG